MSKFVDAVRASKVSQPTQRGFTIDAWEKAYKSHNDSSEEDRHLFESGFWTFSRLNKIRNKLKEISFKKITKSELQRLICGDLNRACHIISQKKVPLINEDTFIAESLIQMKTEENILNPDATPEEVINGLVEGARYPLSFSQDFLKDTAEKQTDLEVLSMLTKNIALGGLYDFTESIWMDSLWFGKYIRKDDKYDVIIDSDVETAINKAVSDYRRQSLILQFMSLSVREWKNLSEELKRKSFSYVFDISIERQGKNKKLLLVPKKIKEEFSPISLLYRLFAEETYFQKLLTVKLPNYYDFTLEHLLTAWEILRILSKKLFSMFPEDSGVSKLNKLLQYAPIIAKDELAQLFSKAMQLNFKKSEQLVNIFIFKETPREELWFHPLVEIDKGKLCPVMAAVLFPNLMRSIDYWLANSGINIQTKGGEFELSIIEELKEGIIESKGKGKLTNVQVRSVSRNPFGEQIDLVIRLGNVFLIGEVKCTEYPAEPLEFYRYYELGSTGFPVGTNRASRRKTGWQSCSSQSS